MDIADVTMPEVALGLLGPVTLLVDGASLSVSGTRRTAVLAALALHRREVVGADRLAEIVWGVRPPRTASDTLRNHVSRLRRIARGQFGIVSRSTGYVLDLKGAITDVEAAEYLVHRANQCSDAVRRKAYLDAAIALWRGPSLLELVGLVWFADQAQRLDGLRLDAQHLLIDTRLELGEHRQLIPEIEELSREHPLDERLHGQLIIALYRCGRQADALAVFHRLRESLDDELGVLPSAALQELQSAVLRQDPKLAASSLLAGVTTTKAAVHIVPAQLPAPITTFVGRDSEFARLDNLVSNRRTHAGPAVVAISGTAGVGKTALAVQWAHHASSSFPDGQLYVNLRGYDPSGSPLKPVDVVRHVLDSFGVPVEGIPPDLDAAAGLCRTVLASKTVLLLLDNARDAEQIRWLIGGSPGSVILVTSRNRLTALAIAHDAQLLTPGPLSPNDSYYLVAKRIGSDRAAAEHDAVESLISRCGGLPLALAIVAAHACAHPTFALSTVAAQLRNTSAGLIRFYDGDPATDLATIFSWSYMALTPPAAQLFRWLGLHPGPHISAAAAASLAALPPDQARGLLTELATANLVSQHSPGRYALHDLLREFAAELAHAHDADETRREVFGRVLDHYLQSARNAEALLAPGGLVLMEPAAGVTPETLDNREAALTWCAAECDSIAAAIERAAQTGFDIHASQLAHTFRRYLHEQRMWSKQISNQQHALASARRLHDRSAQGGALYCLAVAYVRLGRIEDGEAHCRLALRYFAELDDTAAQAKVHLGLASIEFARLRTAEGLTSAKRALQLYEKAEDARGTASALNAIGWGHALSGSYGEAVGYCQQALDILAVDGDLETEVAALHSLGYAYHALQDFAQAARHYERAVALSRTVGDRTHEALNLTGLADAYEAAAERGLAAKVRQEASTLIDRLNSG